MSITFSGESSGEIRKRLDDLAKEREAFRANEELSVRRDDLAEKIMLAMVAAPDGKHIWNAIPHDAYWLADEMLKARAL